MKNLICLLTLFLTGTSSTYAQEWISYQGYQYVQPSPQIIYVQPQPVVTYHWIPYVVQQNVVLEQKRLFCINQTVVARPTIQWILQPVVAYR